MAIQNHIQDNAATTSLIARLKTMQDQVKPLTKEQERELIFQYKDDPDMLQKQLILHNIRLVFNICKKYSMSARSFDDLIGKGMQALVYAASKFDPDRNIKFSTYATNWIFKAAYEYDWQTRVETRDPMNVSTSIDQLISEMAHSSKADGSGASFENFINDSLDASYVPAIPNVDHQVAVNEQSSLFEKLRTYMAQDPEFLPIDPEILTRRFVERQTYTKISDDLDIPTKEVKARERLMLHKFRGYLGEKMNIHSYEDVEIAEKI